jgi:LysR family glycine cleavage system transcriptional activator
VYFYIVALRRSYRLAAEDLGVTVSALSRPIQELERDLDVLLFVRGGRHQTMLTLAGSRFFHKTAETLAMLSEIPRTSDRN